jgi:ABC-type sugar transport system ATPase subunit
MTGKAPEPPLLFLAGVEKRFGGVYALKGVDFELRRGEIHALVGENGAGKSTLIKILGGIHRPDAGQINVDGSRADVRSVGDADELGIRIIHQELSLAPNLSVAENIYLGREPARFKMVDRRRLFRQAARLVAELGLDEIGEVRNPVGSLSVAHRQLVEIARALSCRARILVLDEPTSSLSEAETASLFKTLKNLRSQGVGIIYISHRLEEVIELSDRITVLRDGESIGTQQTSGIDRDLLVRWMVGRNVADHFHRPERRGGRPALRVQNLANASIKGVSFELHGGEILGIAGLVGSGRSELARAIFGIDGAAGRILAGERALSINRPADALREGIVLVPEDRQAQGLIMGQSVDFNIALPWVRQWITACMPSRRRRARIVDEAVRNFSIRLAHTGQLVESLSGGNQQKALLGRWMHRVPAVLILDEPTRGVDVGAREEIFRIIGSFVQEGMAVLLISSDLSEVIGVSHRVALYRDGGIVKIVRAGQIDAEEALKILTAA